MTKSLRNSGTLCTLARACTLALLLFIPFGCLSAATLPKPFIFFNNTRFTNRTLLDTDGLMRSSVVYDLWSMSCSATACKNIPTDDVFLSKMKYYVSNDSVSGGYGSSFLIVLDFEGLALGSATSQGQASNDVSVLAHFATLVHQTYPSALVGAYDYDYNGTYNSTRAQLYGPGGFNVFTPSLYQRWSTHTQWNTYMNAAISNDTAINPALPIYPYISPYVSGSTSAGLLSASEWQSELNDLIASTAGGAVLWTGPATITTTDLWYTELLSVLSPVIDPTQTYYLSNEHNGLCPTLASGTAGASVDQTDCSTSQTGLQEWNFQTTSSGKFYLTNTAAPTEYLTVQGASTLAGALLEGDPAAGSSPSSSQTWHVVSAGKRYYSQGYYVLIGDASSMCVEAPAAGAGAQLVDDVCSTSTQQLYAIHPITVALTSTSSATQPSPTTDQATLTITNNGTAAAQSVTLTSFNLGSAGANNLPVVVGAIPAGGSATVQLQIPLSGLTSGAAVQEKFSGTYKGGTFGGQARTVAP